MLPTMVIVLLAVGGMANAKKGVWKPLPIPIPQPAPAVTVPAATTPVAAATTAAGAATTAAGATTAEATTAEATTAAMCFMGMGCYDAGGDLPTAGCTGGAGGNMCPDNAGTTVCLSPPMAMQGTACTGITAPDCTCAPVTPFPTG